MSSQNNFRAAYINTTVLTGPEHAELNDEDLLSEALAEAKRGDIIGNEPHMCTADMIEIGEWSAVHTGSDRGGVPRALCRRRD